MAPIAQGVAARGHEVHLVLPWHPAITLPAEENGVRFHFFKYAPTGVTRNVFGYAGGLKADTALRSAAWAAAPAALAAGWLQGTACGDAVSRDGHARSLGDPRRTHGRRGRGARPLVVSLHGSDVFVAERNAVAGAPREAAFARAGWVTACSDDLRTRAIALGATRDRIETVPYGVDAARFRRTPAARGDIRRELGLGDAPLVVSRRPSREQEGLRVPDRCGWRRVTTSRASRSRSPATATCATTLAARAAPLGLARAPAGQPIAG